MTLFSFVAILTIIEASTIPTYNLTWKYSTHDLPKAFGYGCTVTAKWSDYETVYIIGGSVNENHLDSIYYMDESSEIKNATIFNAADVPQIGCSEQNTIFNPNDGLIYIVSGAYMKDRVYRLMPNQNNPSKITWSSIQIALFSGAGGESCTSFHVDRNIIITFGGVNKNQTWILSLNDTFPQWITKSSASYTVSSHSCIVSKDTYFSFGGKVDNHQFQGKVLSYDIDKDEWDTNYSPLNIGFYGGRAVEIDASSGLILLVGGLGHDGTTVMPQLYNISTAKQVQITIDLNGLQGGYHKSMVTVFMNEVWMFGGWKYEQCGTSQCEYTNTVQISNSLLHHALNGETTSYPTVAPSISMKVNGTEMGTTMTIAVSISDNLNRGSNDDVSIIVIVIIMIVTVIVIFVSFGFYKWYKQRDPLRIANIQMVYEVMDDDVCEGASIQDTN